ncbi:MAG: GDSL-type esterase/lipase family protein [Mucinivorans sp.]
MNFKPKATFLLTLTTVTLLSLLSILPVSEPLVKQSIFSQLYSDSVLCTSAGYQAIVDEIPIDNLVPITTQLDEKNEPVSIDTNIQKTTNSTDTENNKSTTTKNVDRETPKIESENIYTAAKSPNSTNNHPKTPATQKPASLTAIEDFSTSGDALGRFYASLRNVGTMSRPVRIAVLGDSFIEGDIFTQDLREQLQNHFGGRGVGFVPITSTVASFRQSVKHSFNGWATHSIVNKMSRSGFIISSFTYTPSDNVSSVTYRGSKYKAHLNYFTRARFVFRSLTNAKIKVSINGGAEQNFTPEVSGDLRQVVVMEDSIREVTFTVQSDNNFTAYGAYLDSPRGVSVDNYSVRGNSGVSLSQVDEMLTRQLGEMLPIDLVIFEYGLNVAQADVKSYSLYMSQMKRAIEHLQKCLPQAAILVMSIPDRTRRSSNGWITMPGVEAMARTQRQLAQSTGVVFWSTLDAMRSRGGMSTFVERGWAAKDYTHLSSRGGREIGRALFEALMYDMQSRY